MNDLTSIVLAAGRSRRMEGPNKLLLPWRGRTIVETVLDVVCRAGFGEVLVVTGHDAERLAPVLAGYPVRSVFNPRFADGMGTSLAAGVAAAAEGTAGYLVFLADMPHLTIGTLAAVCDAFRSRPGPTIVVPSFQGRRGHPVLFASAFRPDLLALDGDTGARRVLQTHASAVLELPVDDSGILLDVDTREAYGEWRRASGE